MGVRSSPRTLWPMGVWVSSAHQRPKGGWEGLLTTPPPGSHSFYPHLSLPTPVCVQSPPVTYSVWFLSLVPPGLGGGGQVS